MPIVDGIEERLRTLGAKPVRREGEREGRWVLLDYIDIIVHVQHAEERVYYSLERIWKDCPTVELPEEVRRGRTRLERRPARRRLRGGVLSAPAGPARMVVLWRHGQTAWNLEDRFQGSTDVELDDVGRGQADRAARLLASLAPTAGGVVRPGPGQRDRPGRWRGSLGLEVRLDERLRETYGGSWQGRTVSEMLAAGRRRLRGLAVRCRRTRWWR